MNFKIGICVVGLLSLFSCSSMQKNEQAAREPNQVVDVGGRTLSRDFSLVSDMTGERKEIQNLIDPARIHQFFMLVDKERSTTDKNLQVKVVTIGTGGSTDVSPNYGLYFGIYSQNEMNDLIASYYLGSAYKIDSVKRISGGIYQIVGNLGDYGKKSIIQIDAIKSINEINTLKCEEFALCRSKSNITIKKIK